MMEVKPDAVIFTSGATEANALAIEGAVYGSGKPLSQIHILYLPTAHASSVRTIERLAEAGVMTEPLSLVGGSIDLGAIKNQVRTETFLISLDVVCGETGTRHDSRNVARVLHELGREDVLIHADISQLPLVESIERGRLGADLITLDAQKVGGVRGVGTLVAGRNISLRPLVEGGGQERGLRSGTEPAALIAAFVAALEDCARNREAFTLRARRMRENLTKAALGIPGFVVNEGKVHAPHILNLSFTKRDTDYLAALLDEAGFAVSTKSSCETDAEGSRVVLRMTGDSERALSTLRVSWGPSTKESDLQRFMRTLAVQIGFLDQSAG
jgi:cysteine desulfurase